MANGGIIGPVNDPQRGDRYNSNLQHQEITHHQVLDQALQLF
jgi:hypothetical protein